MSTYLDCRFTEHLWRNVRELYGLHGVVGGVRGAHLAQVVVVVSGSVRDKIWVVVRWWSGCGQVTVR